MTFRYPENVEKEIERLQENCDHVETERVDFGEVRCLTCGKVFGGC